MVGRCSTFSEGLLLDPLFGPSLGIPCDTKAGEGAEIQKHPQKTGINIQKKRRNQNDTKKRIMSEQLQKAARDEEQAISINDNQVARCKQKECVCFLGRSCIDLNCNF